jgi:hypothetical protein
MASILRLKELIKIDIELWKHTLVRGRRSLSYCTVDCVFGGDIAVLLLLHSGLGCLEGVDRRGEILKLISFEGFFLVGILNYSIPAHQDSALVFEERKCAYRNASLTRQHVTITSIAMDKHESISLIDKLIP